MNRNQRAISFTLRKPLPAVRDNVVDLDAYRRQVPGARACGHGDCTVIAYFTELRARQLQEKEG